MTHPDFEVQGHRGARGMFPENTLHGFRAAATLGVRTMELDVGTTRDGAVVVHHDPALNPDTTRDGAGRWLDDTGPLLRDLTLAQLREYDVGRLRPGTAYAEAYHGQVPQNFARVPTLDEVLALDPTLRWNIELKVMPDHPDWTVPPEEMVERVLHVVGAAAAGTRVALQSFDWRAPRHLRRIRPSIAAGWLTAAMGESARYVSSFRFEPLPPLMGLSAISQLASRRSSRSSDTMPKSRTFGGRWVRPSNFE